MDGTPLTDPDLTTAIANGVEFSGIANNHSVVVTTAINTYDVTGSIDNGGTITGTGTVNYGGSTTVTFAPATGYHVTGVTVDGTPLTDPDLTTAITNGRVTLNNITASRNVVVTTAINSHTITYYLNGVEVNAFSGDNSVEYGTSLTSGYAYAPTSADLAGKKFGGWTSTTVGGVENSTLNGALPATMDDGRHHAASCPLRFPFCQPHFSSRPSP